MRMVYMWCALVSDINLTDHTGSKPQARFGSWLQPWRPLCSSHIIMFPVLTPGALFRLPSSLLHISGLSLLLLSWRSLGTTWMQPVCVVPPRGSPFVHVFTLFPHCPPPLLVLIIHYFWREYDILLKSWKPTKTWGLQSYDVTPTSLAELCLLWFCFTSRTCIQSLVGNAWVDLEGRPCGPWRPARQLVSAICCPSTSHQLSQLSAPEFCSPAWASLLIPIVFLRTIACLNGLKLVCCLVSSECLLLPSLNIYWVFICNLYYTLGYKDE